MIKKILIIIFMSLVSIFLLGPPIYAATAETILVEEPAANEGGLWHVEAEDGNRVYVYMRYTYDGSVRETGAYSNYSFPDYDYSTYIKWDECGYYGTVLSFPNTADLTSASITNPNPSIYDRFVVEIISQISLHPGEADPAAAPVKKTVASYDTLVSNVTVDIHNYEDSAIKTYEYLSYMSLMIDGEEVINSSFMEDNPYGDDRPFGVRMYWERTDVDIAVDPMNDENAWDNLPTTEGSPANPVGDWGTVSNIVVSNNDISFDINYQGTNYIIDPFLYDGNLDFIEKSNEVLYYTDAESGDRILYFNFGDKTDSGLLTVRSFSEINEWKGEALWNLTQNEIKVTDVLTVYNYIPEVDKDGNVYSYFYMPDVPVEDLISVTSLLAYRYVTTNFWGNTTEGEVQYKTVAAVKGQTTSVNPSWVEKAYTTAYITAGVLGTLTAVGTVAGVIPGYGWAIAGACFLAGGIIGGALQVADVNEWFAYDVEQIQHVIPDAALSNAINTYIATEGGDDTFSADTDKLYKLHLANLDPDGVQIMSDLSNVTQVVWETDGQIYVVNEDNIDSVDWGGPGTEYPDTTSFLNLDVPDEIIYIVAAVGGIIVFNKLKLDKRPGLLIIVAAVVVYVLHVLGIITWFQS